MTDKKRIAVLEEALRMAVCKVINLAGDICPLGVCHADSCGTEKCITNGVKHFIEEAKAKERSK